MGFLSFLKKVFSLSGEDDAELRAARARHGINLDEKDSAEEDKEKPESYDTWEEIRNFRTYFWLGGWATKKFRVIGEDKLKRDLEKLERKREEERKKGEG